MCRNHTTKQRVVSELEDEQATSWDCETAGLEVQTGDIIIHTVRGVVAQ